MRSRGTPLLPSRGAAATVPPVLSYCGRAGAAEIEPSRMRLLLSGVLGLVVAALGLLMAFGDPAMLLR